MFFFYIIIFIDFKINVVKKLGSPFNISVRNIDNNETLTGPVQFTNYDSDGWVLGGFYYYDGTVNPNLNTFFFTNFLITLLTI